MTGRHSTLIACSLTAALLGCQKAGEQRSESELAPGQVAAQESAPTVAAADEQVALHKADPRGPYGAGVVLQQSTRIDEILAKPAAYEGRIVQVAGTVRDVCARRGCWMEIAEGESSLRVKVPDGEIVFPVSAKGSHAVVEGVVEKIELDAEQHKAWKKHEAEERGVPFDPSSVSGSLTLWQIAGLGARIDG